MIERIRDIVSKGKFLHITLAGQGNMVHITATVRPKDGSDQVKPLSITADWQIADALLIEALHKPPKPGKTEVKTAKQETEEPEADLFTESGSGPDEQDEGGK